MRDATVILPPAKRRTHARSKLPKYRGTCEEGNEPNHFPINLMEDLNYTYNQKRDSLFSYVSVTIDDLLGHENPVQHFQECAQRNHQLAMSFSKNLDLTECFVAEQTSHKPLVICGASGAGKGTLIDKIVKAPDSKFRFSVSYATRAPRPGEVDGVSYNFITKEKFEQMIKEDAFIEYATVHGNYYGTAKQAIRKI